MGTAKYNLEERTFTFAYRVAMFCKDLPRTQSNMEYQKQLIRAAGSVGANYIEANESLGKRDFLFRLRISRREAKEAVYWLRLLIATNDSLYHTVGESLSNEATELKKILSAIIINSQKTKIQPPNNK